MRFLRFSFSFLLFFAGALFAREPDFILPYEPAYIHEVSAFKYAGALARWEKGFILEKDLSSVKSSWKKTRRFLPYDFTVRINSPEGSKLVEVPGVSHLYMTKNRAYAAFTVSFGSSAVSSAAVADLKKNRVIYCADLKQKEKGAKGPPQLAMERSLFFPSVTEDGRHLACDGFDGEGRRQVTIIDTATKSEMAIKGAAMPVIAGGNIWFVLENRASGKNALVFIVPGQKKSTTAAEFEGRALALVGLEKRVYLAAGEKIYAVNAGGEGWLSEMADFSAMKKGYEYAGVEAGYGAYIKKAGCVLLAFKTYKYSKYSWKLAGFRVEQEPGN